MKSHTKVSHVSLLWITWLLNPRAVKLSPGLCRLMIVNTDWTKWITFFAREVLYSDILMRTNFIFLIIPKKPLKLRIFFYALNCGFSFLSTNISMNCKNLSVSYSQQKQIWFARWHWTDFDSKLCIFVYVSRLNISVVFVLINTKFACHGNLIESFSKHLSFNWQHRFRWKIRTKELMFYHLSFFHLFFYEKPSCFDQWFNKSFF